MQPIRATDGQEVTWQQPHAMKRDYELRAGDELRATPQWKKLFGTVVVVETAQGQWSFKRQGFWRPRVTVRQPGSDADIAVFEAGWSSYRRGAENIGTPNGNGLTAVGHHWCISPRIRN